MRENYGTIWVCQCCMLAHANGECCGHRQHGEDGATPLKLIEWPYTVAMGMSYAEHAAMHDMCGIPREPNEFSECGCETDTFSRSACEGCGSYLHGERHAMTLFKEG